MGTSRGTRGARSSLLPSSTTQPRLLNLERGPALQLPSPKHRVPSSSTVSLVPTPQCKQIGDGDLTFNNLCVRTSSSRRNQSQSLTHERPLKIMIAGLQ